MKVKVLKTGLTVEKSVLDVGVTVDLPAEDIPRLTEYGLVEIVEEPETPEELETPEEPEEPETPKKPARGKKASE